MTALSWLGLGILILALLPTIVLTIDRRPTPMVFHIALALCGLLYAGLSAGLTGALLAALCGLGWTIALTLAVANTQNRSGYRMMSGSEIRLFAASATWLPPALTFAVFLLCLLGLAVTLLFRQRSSVAGKRPNLVFYMSASLLVTFWCHLGL